MLFNVEDKSLNKNLHQFKNMVHKVYWWNFWRKTGKTS